MKYIIITEDNKKKNKKLFNNLSVGSIYKKGLPKSFNGVINQDGGYTLSANHEKDGWFSYENPEYNKNTQKLGEYFFDEDSKTFKTKVIDLSQDEIDLNITSSKIKLVQNFLNQKKFDGEAIFNDLELRITMGLIGKPILEVQDIVSQIDEQLYKPLNLVKTGDFASAMFLFISSTEPTNSFILDFWKELRDKVQKYYSENYPTE